MKVGDLVKYKDRYRETIGVIVQTSQDKSTAKVAWSSNTEVWVVDECTEELEVIQDA